MLWITCTANIQQGSAIIDNNNNMRLIVLAQLVNIICKNIQNILEIQLCTFVAHTPSQLFDDVYPIYQGLTLYVFVSISSCTSIEWNALKFCWLDMRYFFSTNMIHNKQATSIDGQGSKNVSVGWHLLTNFFAQSVNELIVYLM